MGATSRSRSLFLLATLLFTACATTLETEPPPDFDLTGTWQLVTSASDPPPSSRHLRARGGMIVFVAQDFPVLRAKRLEIEQNRDSMGIRYDANDYRDVSWGSREHGLWKVQAGWHEGSLVILYHAKDGDAREVMTLGNAGQRLTVDLRVDSGGNHVTATRVYQRVQPASANGAS